MRESDGAVPVQLSPATLALLTALDDAAWGAETPRAAADVTPRCSSHEAAKAAARAKLCGEQVRVWC